MDNSYLEKYLYMALNRKWWIIIPFLLTSLVGLTYALITPKIYEAETLILVQSQKVPQSFVRAIVSDNVEDRLKTITQQVTSRTNLEEVIKQYQLSEESTNLSSLEDQILLLRSRIKIDVSTGRHGRSASAFTIAFRGKDQRKVMQVTNALASNFIAENLKIRESQALGTSTFLADELESVKMRLMQKEEQLKNYRQKFMGGLPEQLDTNLRILERLQGKFEQLHRNLRDAENRKITVQKQIAEEASNRSGAGNFSPSERADAGDLEVLKGQLASIEAKYTEKHPDVIRLRKIIEKLEAEESENLLEPSDSTEEQTIQSVADKAMIKQMKDIDLEIQDLRAEIKKTNLEIGGYQNKVEKTPEREQELLSMNRDYKNLQGLYNSLLNRKLEAEIAVSMEKKQKGEQFRVIDPAKVPINPIEPDLRKIIMLTLALGLGLGGGLVYLIEVMDTSYKTPDDAEEDLKLPVLMSMPIQYTEKELKKQKMKELMVAASVGVIFVVSAIGIVLGIKGVDSTVNYVKEMLAKM